ncbi:MAG: phosphotransferase [Desulfobulbaceae bacterium]|nr:phosphotransferase [Desulfobulbaceae bacterium]
MILEMHCHTEEHSSCSHVKAVDLVRRNFDNGLLGTVLTDHHYLWTTEEISRLRREAAVPDYYLVLPGQEISTSEIGDVLVYGATRSLARGTPLADIRREFPEAALVWAHPFRGENLPQKEQLLHELLDGIEIFSSNHTVMESHRALISWHKYKFTAIAGTDAHALSYAGIYPTVFDHPFTSINELAMEIRAGRCRPYFKEIPRSGTTDTKVLELAIGIKSRERTRENIMIKTPENMGAWETAARTQQIMEKISEKGFREGRFRLPMPLGLDKENLSVFEEGILGRTLFDVLVEASPETAPEYLKLTAQWLARLHNAGLQITPPEEFLRDEYSRLERYLSAFYSIDHAHTRRAQEIMDAVISTECTLYPGRYQDFVQGHGDFHPKNIYIGNNLNDDPEKCFIAAIDFDSSYCMPRAFDVGTFMAQFRNQFFSRQDVLDKVDASVFLQEYLQEVKEPDDNFTSQVELFKARTTLSICYYLIRVGLGDSENLWRVLVEAEQNLAGIAAKGAALHV